MQLLHKVTGNNRELKSSAYRLQNCISLADLLSTVSMPAGKDNLIVAVEYRQLDGVQYRLWRKDSGILSSPSGAWLALCRVP